MTMLERLKKYLDSKPIEELQKEWDELEGHKFPNSPTVEEFLKAQKL